MTGAAILDIARDGIVTFLKVAAPLMMVALAVGLVISLLQALTQIQEQTLVYVPKILAMFGHDDPDAAPHGRRARRLHDPHRRAHRRRGMRTGANPSPCGEENHVSSTDDLRDSRACDRLHADLCPDRHAGHAHARHRRADDLAPAAARFRAPP